MQIKFVSVMVDDQERALRFYTDVLGFVKAEDVPVGEHRWLTVTSPDGVDGVELVLEPMAFPPAREYQRALFEAGVPATAFVTSDIRGEYARLAAAGVRFRGESDGRTVADLPARGPVRQPFVAAARGS